MSELLPEINVCEFLLIPVIIAAILGLMYTVKILVARLGMNAEVQRKIIHIAVGLSSLSFPLVFSGPLPVLLLIACAIATMLILRQTKQSEKGIGSVLHSVERASYGEIYLALAVAFLFFRSADNWILYVLPLLVISLSDSASALVGTTYGKLRFAVDDGHKSVEGTLVFFGVTLIFSMITLLLMSEIPRPNVVILSFLIAVFCTLVEADSWRGLDNLFVPVGAHLLLEQHLETDPTFLLLFAIVFMAAIFAALHYGKRIGLTAQTTRAYVIVLFLIVSVANLQNGVLPLLAIISHLVVRALNPSNSTRPDLDFLAIATAVGLSWMLIGESSQLNAINLFNLTFAGVAIIFSTLTAKGNNINSYGKWMLGPVLLAVALVSIWAVDNNSIAAQWYGRPWQPIVISLLICLGIAWLATDWFAHRRVTKAFAIALATPITLFISHGVFS